MSETRYTTAATVHTGEEAFVGDGDIGAAFTRGIASGGWVEDGGDIDADFANGHFSIDSTLLYLLGGTDYRVNIGSTVGLDLEAPSGTNHLYVHLGTPDIRDRNTVTLVVNDTGTAPAEPSLKLAEVDGGAETSTKVNQEPSINADRMDANTTDAGEVRAGNAEITGGPSWLSGDYDVLATPTSGPISASFTTTSSWESTILVDDIPSFDLSLIPTENYASIRIAFVSERIKNDTSGETTTVRAAVNNNELPNCTVSATGGQIFDAVSSVSDPIGITNGSLRLQTQGQVTGGTGNHRGSITFLILGEIA